MVTLLIALIAGILLTTAFAPFGWWPVAFISTAILIGLWSEASPRQAAWRGYLFGLGFFSTGVSWVFNSIHEFGQAPVPVAVALTLLLILVLSLFPALSGWVQAPRSKNKRSKNKHSNNERLIARYLFIIPSIWVLTEWLRGWILTGFPWLQLGYSQLDSVFSSLGPLVGVLGISWAILFFVGLGFTALQGRGSQRVVALVSMVGLLLVLVMVDKIQWTQKMSDELDVRLIQGNISQENKWKKSWLIPTVERYVGLTEENLDADLIVWPEVALPGRYSLFEPNVLSPLQKKLVSSNTELVFGVLKYNDAGLHNALVKLGEDTQTYLKRHLVPFGEYIPFRNLVSWIGDLVILPSADLVSATKANTLSVGAFQAGGSICYEDAFGAEVTTMLPAANFLINVSNDAWFGDSLAPHQHLEIARMRALETGRPLLRATNTGVSAVVDHKGEIKSISPQFEIDVLRDKITPRTGTTPYVRWQNKFVLIAMLILLMTGLFLRNKHRRKAS